MKAHISDIDYETAAKREKEVRHDVMAHIYTYGLCCPTAKPIIHLGATSCYVGDNTDIILQRDALKRIRTLLVNAIGALADLCGEVQGSADPRIYPFPGGSAHDCGQTGDALDAGSDDGP